LVVEEVVRQSLSALPPAVVLGKLREQRSAVSFAHALQQLIDGSTVTGTSGVQKINPSSVPPASPLSFSSSASARRLLREVEEIGWERVESVSPDLLSVVLKLKDDVGREHRFEVVMTSAYPAEAPRVSTSLPVQSIFPWGHGSRLSDVLCVVHDDICRHQQYFDALDTLDKHVWVLEPAQPTYSVPTRRIAIEKTCSVIVEVDCMKPTAMCDMRFLGAPERVEHMKNMVGTHLHAWDSAASLRQNLETVLGVPLMRPQDRITDSFSMECGICYSYLETKAEEAAEDCGGVATAAGGDTPNQVCPNARCGRVYHHSCLHDWLQSLPTSRNSFGTLFGECPYCQDPISTRLSR
jgi:E3 ubiquitin-protein ligase FANCL